MNCRVCGVRLGEPAFNAKCGPWYRCNMCGSQSNQIGWQPWKYQTWDTIDGLMAGCGSLGKLRIDQTENMDWFLKYPGHDPVFLDVGCAAGVSLKGMRDRGYTAWGFDVCQHSKTFDENIVCAREFRASIFDGREILSGNVGPPGFTGFGAVLCREVIEHVADWKEILREMWIVMADGGVCQIQTPHSLGAEPDERIHQELHLQIFSPLSLILGCKTVGFQLLESRYWDGGQAHMFRKVPFHLVPGLL